MKISFILNSLIIFFGVVAEAQIVPTALRCEYLENPPVVDVLNPRLSWVNVASEGIADKLKPHGKLELRVQRRIC